MKTQVLTTFFSCIVFLTLTGCATKKTERIVPGGSQAITTTGIDQKDWDGAAVTMIDSLNEKFINAGKLQSPPDKPALLAISLIRNNTGLRIDTDLLVKKIQIALNQTDKVVTSTTIGIGDAADPIAVEEKRRLRLLGIEPSRPNYTLSGKIIEQVGRAGNVREATYTFQLSLTKTPEGFAVWEDEHPMTKQTKRSRLGL